MNEMTKGIIILIFILLIAIVSFKLYKITVSEHDVNILEYLGLALNKRIVPIKTSGGNKYEMPGISIYKGDFIVYTIGKNQGFNLQKGSVVKISLNKAANSEEHCIIGYIFDNECHNIFSQAVTDAIDIQFTAEYTGMYFIYAVGASASYTEYNGGEIIIK